MTFKPMNTRDEQTAYRKLLLYGDAGAGKTTQAAHYQRHFGPGFIISGEAGLSSIRGANIDYLPFSRWDGEGKEGTYSFRDICRIMASPEFKAAGYKWIMVDSLTELSDLAVNHFDRLYAGDKNKFAMWGDYAAAMVGACKWVRDLPYHVCVTALAKHSTDDNGDAQVWPFVKGNAVQQQLPGIFDCVWGMIRATHQEGDQEPTVERQIITEAFHGWTAKTRDESRSLNIYERTGDVTDLFRRMDSTAHKKETE